MADASISALTAAAALVGTETVPIAQGTSTVRTTTQDIADLGLSALNVVSNNLSNLLSLHDVLSNRVSANSATGGTGSVTSTELSAAVGVSAIATGLVSVKGLQSVINTLSDRISGAYDHATSADTHANAASAAATSVDARVNTVSKLVSALMAVSAKSAATSVRGLQSIVDQLSNRMSGITGGTGSVTSTELSAAVGISCRAFSASGSAGTSVKGLQSVINRISNTFSNAFSAGSVLSLAHTSVANQINNVSCVSAGGTAIGLQSVVNALSARIVASVTSAEYASTVSIANQAASAVSLVSCVSAAGTAVGLQSVVNALSAAAQTASAAATSVDGRVTSVNNNFTSGLGTNVAIGKNGNAQVLTGASFGNVSGLVVPMAANGIYQVDGRVFFTLSILTGTAFGFTYNTTGNGQIIAGCMGMRCVTSIIAGAISNLVSTNWSYGNIAEANMSNAATANISILGGASARTHCLEIEGMLQNGNSAVNLQLQAKHSASGGGINVLQGSYIRAFRVG